MKEVKNKEKFNFKAIAILLLIVQAVIYYGAYCEGGIQLTNDNIWNLGYIIGYNIWLIFAVICLIIYFKKTYGKNELIKNNTKTEYSKKINKNKKRTKDPILLYIIIISITIIGAVGIFSYFNYQKEQLKQQEINKRLEDEKNEKENRRTQLNSCLNRAESNRTSLWNANCVTQSDGSCKIRNDSGTIEWIEQRYQQDVKNCYQLFGD